MITIHKVHGFSMDPEISNNSYVISRSFTYKKNRSQFLLFEHKEYGKLIKKLKVIDKNKKLWFEGNSKFSISSKEIGPIKLGSVIGEIIISISESKIKIFS